jgi:hypothetical protein
VEKPSYDELEKEVANLRARIDKTSAPRRRVMTWRRFAAGLLIFAGSIALVMADVGLWANRNIISNEGFTAAVAPLAHDNKVQAALTKVVQGKIDDTVDIQGAVARVLPPNASFLVPPVTTQVDNAIHSALGKIVSSQRFADVWASAATRAHQRVLTAVQRHADNGQITLDDAYASLAERLKDTQVGAILQNNTLPAKFGSIQIVNVQWLPAAHAALAMLGWIVPVATLVALLALAGSIWISPHRRKTVIAASLSVALALAVANILVRLVEQARLSSIADSVYRQAAQATVQTLTGPLITQTRVWILVALVVATGAWLSGPFRAAEGLRNWFSRVSRGIMSATGDIGARTPAVRWLLRRRRAVEISLLVLAVALLMFMTPLTIATLLWTTAALVVLVLLIEIITSPTKLQEA